MFSLFKITKAYNDIIFITKNLLKFIHLSPEREKKEKDEKERLKVEDMEEELSASPSQLSPSSPFLFSAALAPCHSPTMFYSQSYRFQFALTKAIVCFYESC